MMERFVDEALQFHGKGGCASFGPDRTVVWRSWQIFCGRGLTIKKKKKKKKKKNDRNFATPKNMLVAGGEIMENASGL
jgi:hypothetical protein